MTTVVHFFADSDMQYDTKIMDAKRTHVRDMTAIMALSQVDCIILPGDLTSTGWSKDDSLGGCIWPHDRIKTRNRTDELELFLNDYYQPLRNKTLVLPCAGNHDTYSPGQRAYRWVKQLYGHGKGYYDKMVNGVRFLCLDIYPNKEVLEWMKQFRYRKTPTILFFHFPLIGPHSGHAGSSFEVTEWWGSYKKEKALKDTLLEYVKTMNVLGIFVGHAHDSYMMDWNGYKMYVCGGEYFADARVKRSNGVYSVEVMWRNDGRQYYEDYIIR